MPRFVALQMDHPAGINPAGDTSMLLGLEALRRGYSLFYYDVSTLAFENGILSAVLHPLIFHDRLENWHELGAAKRRPLNEMDFILMRQNPPFDMNYITACHYLELLPKKTKVLNNPFWVRNLPEKIFPLEFPDFIPATLITRKTDTILEFLYAQEKIVVKPLYGFGGNGVFLLDRHDKNLNALLELYTSRGEPLVVQEFLPDIAKGDTRVIFIDGKVEAVFTRIPANDEIRSNLRVGASAEKHELSSRQKGICERLGPVLKERGILLAGVDLIGDYLIEINITSPTGLRAAKKLYGTEPETRFWDAAEAL